MFNHDKIYDRNVAKVKTRKAKKGKYEANSSKQLQSQFKTVTHAEQDDTAADKDQNPQKKKK